jgi:Replication-relaxation
MATAALTPRDFDILQAVERCPLTAAQLLRLSETFPRPFRTEHTLRIRLFKLAAAGQLRRWPYAIAGRGMPGYYRLTRQAYRLLHPERKLPGWHTFAPIGIARQHHSHFLADFIVHTAVGAHHAGVLLTEFSAENTLRLTVGDLSLYPDNAFTLVTASERRLAFFVELDNSTETIRSPHNDETWERKLAFYEAYQNQSRERFRVLVVSTRNSTRPLHILASARSLTKYPLRSLFYGITLTSYLKEKCPLTAPCFLDHRGKPVALVPPERPTIRHTPQAASAVLRSVSC